MTDILKVAGGRALRGCVSVPGDKSISHRSLIFNGFASGAAAISGLLDAEDVASTARCMDALGASFASGRITGCGGRLRAPSEVLDCGNSGTTMRLLLGLLAGQDFSATLTGDASLRSRPMGRVTVPLGTLGAQFSGANGGEQAPLMVTGGSLLNGRYVSPIASAQVKTAMLLAGLQGEGILVFEEPSCSRDHSERMLMAMGVEMERTIFADGRHQVRLVGPQRLQTTDVVVPGDISSAAFFLVAASIVPDSDITITGVGLNPTRTGVLDVLERMGADIQIENAHTVSGEPVGDLHVRSSALKGTDISKAEIPRLIDELPVIAVAAAMAEGETCIRDAAELRVKESDRITATVGLLIAMGAQAEARPDGMLIAGFGGRELRAAHVHANGDHRIAMTAMVAGLVARGETKVSGASCIATSFPAFHHILETLRG